MTSHREALVGRVLQAHWALYRVLQEGAAALWVDLDLTMAQVKAILILCDAGAMPIGQLGAALGIGRPAASFLVDALVREGLVERSEDESDRRRTLARPTPRARELVERLYQGRRERLEAWIGRLDDADLAALARGLSALAGAAGAREPAPTD
jgi:DNA-binding MarR family transcriptional regulator